jgi:hypothetical protein
MLDQKHLENFEMWCRRRTEKISWSYRGRYEEVLHGVKEDRNYHTHNKRRKAKWIGHILGMNCLLGHVIGGKVEGRYGEEEDVSNCCITLWKR